jgi:hypothetical protein
VLVCNLLSVGIKYNYIMLGHSFYVSNCARFPNRHDYFVFVNIISNVFIRTERLYPSASSLRLLKTVYYRCKALCAHYFHEKYLVYVLER